ncbi:MAG: hypothetical protein WAU88_08525 [Candidatus Zixiibacteriota bacterium]
MKRLIPILLLLCAGCVKVHLASETPQQRTEAANVQGKDWRATFAEKIRAATPASQVEMTKRMIDSVTAAHFRFGDYISEQWHQANSSSGRTYTDREMADMVSKWTETKLPLFQAYEESIEYGIEQIKLGQFAESSILQQLEQYRDHFYSVYNAVYFPKGLVGEYDNNLSDLRSQGARLSRDLDESVRMIR